MSRENVRTDRMNLGAAQLARRLHVASLPELGVPARQRIMGFVDGWVLVAIVATFCALLIWGGQA